MVKKANSNSPKRLSQQIFKGITRDIDNVDLSVLSPRENMEMRLDDHQVGTLDTFMQKMWVLRCRYQILPFKMAENFLNLFNQYPLARKQGPKAKFKALRELELKASQLKKDIVEPYVRFKLVDDVFDGTLLIQFPVLAYRTHYGIREGKKAVWREKHIPTGGNKEDVVNFFKGVNKHLSSNGFPELSKVRKTLEEGLSVVFRPMLKDLVPVTFNGNN